MLASKATPILMMAAAVVTIIVVFPAMSLARHESASGKLILGLVIAGSSARFRKAEQFFKLATVQPNATALCADVDQHPFLQHFPKTSLANGAGHSRHSFSQ